MPITEREQSFVQRLDRTAEPRQRGMAKPIEYQDANGNETDKGIVEGHVIQENEITATQKIHKRIDKGNDCNETYEVT